ncbi:MAG: Tfp pilus assembly protein FimT/FimU [Burkholderiaceae bacterium]
MQNRFAKLSFQTVCGFGLVELLVTISVIAILVMVAVPSLKPTTDHNQLQAAMNALRSDIRLAKHTAIQTGQVTQFYLNQPVDGCPAKKTMAWAVTNAAGAIIKCQPASAGLLANVNLEVIKPAKPETPNWNYKPDGLSSSMVDTVIELTRDNTRNAITVYAGGVVGGS